MKKILFIIFIINFICYHICFANDINNHNSNIKYIFKENFKIVFTDNSLSQYNMAIDYSIEILHKIPNSLEAFITINCVNKISLPNNRELIRNKYDELFKKYYRDLANINDNIPQKLVLSAILYHGSGNSLTVNEADQNFEAGLKFLTQVKDSNHNDYAPLACLLLAYTNPKFGTNYYKEFKKKFKKHVAIPFIDMYIIYDEYCINKKEFTKAVELLNDLVKNNDITTPTGHIKIDYYEMIIQCFIEANDYDNAKLYLEKIKIEVPDYWNLKNIEKELKRSFNK